MTEPLEISDSNFIARYVQNAPQIMWFFGAGTSRTAGMPTATDIIRDLKRKSYCHEEKLYFVCETKSTLDNQERRNKENQKILCGKRHFQTIGVDFDVVTKLAEVNF